MNGTGIVFQNLYIRNLWWLSEINYLYLIFQKKKKKNKEKKNRDQKRLKTFIFTFFNFNSFLKNIFHFNIPLGSGLSHLLNLFKYVKA